jgi:hypothetical protein
MVWRCCGRMRPPDQHILGFFGILLEICTRNQELNIKPGFKLSTFWQIPIRSFPPWSMLATNLTYSYTGRIIKHFDYCTLIFAHHPKPPQMITIYHFGNSYIHIYWYPYHYDITIVIIWSLWWWQLGWKFEDFRVIAHHSGDTLPFQKSQGAAPSTRACWPWAASSLRCGRRDFAEFAHGRPGKFMEID